MHIHLNVNDELTGVDLSAEGFQARHLGMIAEKVTYEAVLETAGISSVIDEFALLVGTAQQEYAFIEAAVRNGYTYFNAAVDSVVTSPIRSEYNVHYSFLMHESEQYRLEVMRPLNGISPLHMTMMHEWSVQSEIGLNGEFHGCNPMPVHASFKVATELDYAEATRILRDVAGYDNPQQCKSTYGMFSYWQDPSVGAHFPMLKARVNLRDQA